MYRMEKKKKKKKKKTVYRLGKKTQKLRALKTGK